MPRGRKSDAFSFWQTKEGKRRLRRIAKDEEDEQRAQLTDASSRLRKDGWVRRRSTGEFVQLSQLRAETFANLPKEKQEDIRRAGRKGERFGHNGEGPWNYWGKGFGTLGGKDGYLGGAFGLLGECYGVLGADSGKLGADSGQKGAPFGDAGAQQGADWFLTAPMENLLAIIRAGEEYRQYAPPADLAAQDDIGRRWISTQCPDAVETLRDIGRNALLTATPAQRVAILSGKNNTWAETEVSQRAGAAAGHASQARVHIPCPPPLPLDHQKWACTGCTDFACIADLSLNNMIGATEIEILRWVCYILGSVMTITTLHPDVRPPAHR